MFTDFTNTPNFNPWTHVPNQVPLTQGVTADNTPLNDLEKAWKQKKATMFAGKMNKPDSEDADTLNHLIWYEATGFTRPYPGEKTVRPPSEFADRLPLRNAEHDD
jgi:hypothetical protein